MVVIVNKKNQSSTEDGGAKHFYRSRQGKGWSKRRGADIGHIKDTYHGKSLLQSTAVKRFQPSFPHTHVRVIVETDICSISEARMAWGQTVMLYKVINACPSNRVRAILDVNPIPRTSMHPQIPRVHNILWTSFRGFLRHSAILPVSLMSANDQGCPDHTIQICAHSPSESGRNRLYMRMTLAERDSLLKHHVSRLPLYANHLLGAYQDPHQNTVIVLADMQQSCLAHRMHMFKGSEDVMIGSVLLPLLQQLSALHSHNIAHRHLSPWHVFIPSEQARSLTCSLPCPGAHPADINKLLATAVPDEYFAPEVWSINGEGLSKERRDTCLKCDMWSLGVICTHLLLGQTVFQSRHYSTIFHGAHQREQADTTRAEQPSISQPRESRSLLSWVSQVINAAMPKRGPILVTAPSHGIGASNLDVTQDVYVPDSEDCFLEAAVMDQVKVLVEQQIEMLKRGGASSDLLVLVRGLLEPHPDRRLTVSDALASPVFRTCSKTDVAGHSRGHSGPTHPSDSASPAPGVQLWGVVRQSRPQLAEMARRETLVATLADRRDAFDRLADLVNATLACDSTHAEMGFTASSFAGTGAEQDAMRGDVDSMKCDASQRLRPLQWTPKVASQHCATLSQMPPHGKTPPDHASPVTLMEHRTAESGRISQDVPCMDSALAPVFNLSGRVRFTGVVEAASTIESNSVM